MPKKTTKSSRAIESNAAIEARRKYDSKRIAAWRKQRAQMVADLQESINLHRAVIGLPLQDFSRKPTKQSKGGPDPVYLPPPEEMVLMTENEISDWKKAERKKRRKFAQRTAKKSYDAMVSGLKTQLAELKQMLKDSSDQDALEKTSTGKPAAKSSGDLPGVTHFQLDQPNLGVSIASATQTNVNTPEAIRHVIGDELCISFDHGLGEKTGTHDNKEEKLNDAECTIINPNSYENEIEDNFSALISSLSDNDIVLNDEDDISVFSDINFSDCGDD